MKKQRNSVPAGDYTGGIGDAQFALVVLLATSAALVVVTLAVILWIV
ncbi:MULTISPECIES: hypothetical protein [Yersinia]|nr:MULTISPECIES: hypothetical protein [Yersinia]